MNVFDDIKNGLSEAIEYEKGNIPARTTVLEISPVECFNAQEIKSIRQSTGLTQKKFALFMGVSVKTVEAWESGKNKPEGSSCRMLSLTKNDPLFPRKSGIVAV